MFTWTFQKVTFITLLICIITIFCERNFTQFTTTNVSLTSEYVGVTEVELFLKVDSSLPYDSYELLRDGQRAMSGPLRNKDTSLIDSSLLPSHIYTYQAALIRGTKISAPSPELTITTLDTTIHDFQWEIFTIVSPYGSAGLYDVAIIDENDIWAVGDIYADSTEPWVPYNAVHWDGNEWVLKRIPFIGSCSAVDYPPIRAIWAFSENNILFTNGGAIAGYIGGTTYLDCGMNPLLDGAIREIFATDPSNVYAVGGTGTIVHYKGNSWQKMESGTDLPIRDICGVVDWKTGKENILAVACNLFSGDGISVLQITENSVNQVSTTNLPINISSVWSWKGREWYICGSGLYRMRNLDMPWEKVSDLPSVFQTKVRGNGPNDIFVVGHFCLILHWNGSTWRRYSGMTGIYDGLAIKDDLVVAVGSKMNGIVAGDGIILIGRRN